MKKLFYPPCIGLLLFLTTEAGYAKVNQKRMYKTIAVLTSDSLGGRAAGRAPRSPGHPGKRQPKSHFQRS